MLTVEIYDDHNLINLALQDLDTDDFESCEFSTKLESKLLEIWKNNWHVSDSKIIQTTRKVSYFGPYKGKVIEFLMSLEHKPLAFLYLQ